MGVITHRYGRDYT